MNVGDRFKFAGFTYEIMEVKERLNSSNLCIVKNLVGGTTVSAVIHDNEHWVKPPCRTVEDSPFMCAVAEYKTSFDALDAAKKAEVEAWDAWKATAEASREAHLTHMAASEKFKNYVKENL